MSSKSVYVSARVESAFTSLEIYKNPDKAIRIGNQIVKKAIKNNIAIFSLHTALDNSWNGVNAMICNKLNLTNRRVLIPKKNTIKKLTTYVPEKHFQNLLSELFKAGAGTIGNYSNCSFSIDLRMAAPK